MLEAQLHHGCSFVTLTYRDEARPPELVPRHLTLYLKALRHEFPPGSVRYYAVGEYGERSNHPHYHLALFGVGMEWEEVIRSKWPYGGPKGLRGVHVGELNAQSAQYIAGYVTKKWTKENDFNRAGLAGRHPEFARMSLRPGIGAGAMRLVADALVRTPGGLQTIRDTGDVPVRLAGAKKSQVPLGRYLRRKLREEVGFEEIGSPEAATLKRVEEMQALLEDSGGAEAFRKRVVEVTRIGRVENKARIFSKKGSV